jgi:hypothetical protein
MTSAAQIAMALDPSLIFTRAGMTADLWQAEVLRARAPRLLLNCSRQAGKSQTVAAMAIDEALSHGPSLVLVLSPSQRQSQLTFRTVMELYHKLELGSIAPDMESSLRAEFPNGSRIIALPGKEATIRGLSKVGLLILDEASRIDDALYHAVQPMLAVSGGRVVALSTPCGKRGFFYHEWAEGEGWMRVCITANQCRRIDAQFLAQQRRSMPAAIFRQEYECSFEDSEGQVFAHADVMAALSNDVKPLFPVHSALSNDVKPLMVV